MEIRELETFLKVYELANFTKAAEKLNYTQSNVSSQISKLETEFGSPLFNRIGHKISLTHKGFELLSYAQKIVSLSKTAQKNLSNSTKSKIKIAASESLCTYKLPAFIKSYQHDFPNTELYVDLFETDQYATYFSSTDTDFAYVLDSGNPISSNENNKIKILKQEKITVGLFTTNSYLETSKINPTSLKQLSNQKLILTKPDCCYRKQFEKLMSTIPFNLVLETSSLQVIKEMTLSNLGICLLPFMAVETELKNSLLVALPIKLDIHVFSQVITHKDKWLSPEVQNFIERMK